MFSRFFQNHFPFMNRNTFVDFEDVGQTFVAFQSLSDVRQVFPPPFFAAACSFLGLYVFMFCLLELTKHIHPFVNG